MYKLTVIPSKSDPTTEYLRVVNTSDADDFGVIREKTGFLRLASGKAESFKSAVEEKTLTLNMSNKPIPGSALYDVTYTKVEA
jgi:hypothetical protein